MWKRRQGMSQSPEGHHTQLGYIDTMRLAERSKHKHSSSSLVFRQYFGLGHAEPVSAIPPDSKPSDMVSARGRGKGWVPIGEVVSITLSSISIVSPTFMLSYQSILASNSVTPPVLHHVFELVWDQRGWQACLSICKLGWNRLEDEY